MTSHRQLTRILVALFCFFQFSFTFLSVVPGHVDSGNIYTASDVLSNSRLSFYAYVNGATSAGSSLINIKTSQTGNMPPDINAKNIFPLDNVSVGPNGLCTGSTCQISTRSATLATLDLIKGLTVGASDGDPIYATQSAIHTLAFTTQTTVANGKIRVLIPAGTNTSASNNGAPDGGPTSGFDLNGLSTAASFSLCPTGAGVTWTSATPVITDSTTTGNGYHQFDCAFTGSLTTNALTMTIGNTTRSMVNPAPRTAHVQGTADTYNVRIQLLDNGGSPVDSTIVTVSPIEGVLVSATVNPSLTFTIAGETSGNSRCGSTTNITTTAQSVPFGDITATAQFYNGSHQLSASTNANSGYAITVAEDDEMSPDLNGDGVADAGVNIPNTTCDAATCNATTKGTWVTNATAYGFGYSLQNVSATAIAFTSADTNAGCTGNTGGNPFCAKPFACNVTGTCGTVTAAQTVANSTAPSATQSFYVCYRLNVGPLQQPGYYQTRLYYNAVGNF